MTSHGLLRYQPMVRVAPNIRLATVWSGTLKGLRI